MLSFTNINEAEPSNKSTESEPADDEDAKEQKVSVEMKEVFFPFFGVGGGVLAGGDGGWGKSDGKKFALSLCARGARRVAQRGPIVAVHSHHSTAHYHAAHSPPPACSLLGL